MQLFACARRSYVQQTSVLVHLPLLLQSLNPAVNRIVLLVGIRRINWAQQQLGARLGRALEPLHQLRIVTHRHSIQPGNDHVIEFKALRPVNRHHLQAVGCLRIRRGVQAHQRYLERGDIGNAAGPFFVLRQMIEERFRIGVIGRCRNARRAAEQPPRLAHSFGQWTPAAQLKRSPQNRCHALQPLLAVR
jgi:hypothetical protein